MHRAWEGASPGAGMRTFTAEWQLSGGRGRARGLRPWRGWWPVRGGNQGSAERREPRGASPVVP